ncbi:MAG: glycoside hydrolase family 127 protein [Candidatus Hydrogenedentes bacterium]|nr:glycoside hydrolase family 127 protein [Candidatus Hydrogenedentota bacterium]
MRQAIKALAMAGGVLMMASWAQAYELERVDLDSVEVGGEMGRRIQVTVDNNLMKLDVDGDFLKPFRERNAPGGFVGLGMLIDAMARIARHTQNPALIERKEHVVNAALAAQEADGYLGMMREDARIAKLWDVHEMAYLVLGLTSDYELFGKEESLAGAKRLADYLIARLTATPAPDVFDTDISPTMPITGLADAFLCLSEQSGDERYRAFCLDALHVAEWRKPIVKGRWGAIDGHVYAYVDKCLVQLRLDPDGKDAGLHAATQGVLDFILKGNGLAISGACGDHECWHDTQAGMSNLGETCASTYMLKFYDELLRQKPAPLYGDLMERTIYNTLFAAQSPDGRRIRYYSPFEAPRVYFTKDSYCCPNNYRRGLADLPRFIVYRAADGLLVNLYTASTVNAALEDGTAVEVRQETDYPNSGSVTVHVSPAADAEFALSLRIPRWCAGARVAVNGEAQAEPAKAGTFYTLRRVWKPGDTVELELPMECRLVKGRRAQAGRVAIMRGPQLFALNPAGNEGMAGIEPRLLTLDVDSVAGPVPDDSVRPGGMACTVKVWDPGVWYPGGPERTLRLTEFADPGAVAAYFCVPNPEDERYVDDELFAPTP